MKKIGPDTSWLKVAQRPLVYATGLPDFIDLGTTTEWEMDEHVAALAAFTANYDWRNSTERTDESSFRRSIRIMPAMDFLVANVKEDANVPWGQYPFNRSQQLIDGCKGLIAALLPRFSAATGNRWQCSSIQVTGMQPGVILKPHIDGYLAHTLVEKIHIPLSTNERCRQMTYDKDSCLARSIDHLQPGNVYCINNLEPHSACNLGSELRWHVIVDVVESAAWAALRAQAAREYPEIPNVYRVNTADMAQGNQKFYAAFMEVHGTLEPRRYVHSLLSRATYCTRDNRRVTQ